MITNCLSIASFSSILVQCAQLQVPFSTLIADVRMATTFLLCQMRDAVDKKYRDRPIQQAALCDELVKIADLVNGPDNDHASAQAGPTSMWLLLLLSLCQFWDFPGVDCDLPATWAGQVHLFQNGFWIKQLPFHQMFSRCDSFQVSWLRESAASESGH